MTDQAKDQSAGGGLDDALQREIDEALGGKSLEELLDERSPLPTPKQKGAAEISPGNIVDCRVAAVDDDAVLVEMGGKDQGFCLLEQFEKAPEPGAVIQLEVVRFDKNEDMWALSRHGAVERASWDSLVEGQILEGFVEGMNKGGLEVKFSGIKGFMPLSQISMYRVEDASEFLGKKMRVQVIEVDRSDRRVIVSARAVMELEAEQKREQLMAELKEGDVRQGVIRQVMPYGAFVDLGGVDGLVHVSQMSYSRVEDPTTIVKPGQTVEVKVLKIDKEANRISLGMKQVQPDPWESVEKRILPGTTVTVRVVKMENFGSFAEVEPGLEALIPISEMSWTQRVKHPSELFTVGQMVQAVVLSVDAGKKRMSLSIKAVQANPWVGVSQRYPAPCEISGRVTRVAEFGAFVELEPGVEGLVHISQLSNDRVRRVEDAVQVGQVVKAKVLEVDEANRRISLSIKDVIQAAQSAAADTAAVAEMAARQPKKRKKPLKGGLD